MSNWLVFGGWALRPDILRAVFGDQAVYVDTNLCMEGLFRDQRLREDWPERLIGAIAPRLPARCNRLAGWSTGAIIAAALSRHVNPERLALLSVTPSFCRREGFKHGTRPSVLQAMRAGLATDTDETLTKFCAQAGLDKSYAGPYSAEQLSAGLHFLEQASLLPLAPINQAAIVLHGETDAIIPAAAGREFAASTGAAFSQLSGGHGFFLSHISQIQMQLDRVV
jgi:pimeloyl-ACP methyl ester carboxylesterase